MKTADELRALVNRSDGFETAFELVDHVTTKAAERRQKTATVQESLLKIDSQAGLDKFINRLRSEYGFEEDLRKEFDRLAYSEPYVAMLRGLMHNGLSETDALKFIIVSLAKQKNVLVQAEIARRLLDPPHTICVGPRP